MALDEIDRKIIAATQQGLPITPQPYHVVAENIGEDVALVMQRMQAMLNQGVIRRIAAVPNHYRLGYRFNGMTVWDIADDQIDEVGLQIGALDFVSHCYHRPRHLPDWPYNLFAMVHAQTEEAAMEQVRQIQRLLGEHYRQHEVLFSSRILKKTGLRISA
jgi:DNA-binding Lrp family transcriptional regulator